MHQKKSKRVKTARFAVDGLKGVTIALEPVKMGRQPAFHAIDVDGQLFDDGVDQVGGRVQGGPVRQVTADADLDAQLHRKVTSLQIDERVGGRDQKFYGIDPGGRGSQLHELHPQQGRIRLFDLEHLQISLLSRLTLFFIPHVVGNAISPTSSPDPEPSSSHSSHPSRSPTFRRRLVERVRSEDVWA